MIKKDGATKKLVFLGLAVAISLILFTPGDSYALSITKENVIDLTNKSRLENGSGVVVEHPNLTQAAQAKADDMINRQYWAHYYNGEKPWDWMKRAGYEYIEAGENLAIDFTEAKTMNQAWLDSESHRRNMLNSKYQDIGVGIASGWFEDHDTIIVVQMFGRTSEQVVQKKKDVISSKIEVSGDSLDLETEEVATNNNNNFTNKLRGFFEGIGQKTISLNNVFNQAVSNSISWIGNNLFYDFRVFAD
jgi:uncharacterized protein YkwD